MRVWVLGSGGPSPSPTRACSGYLIEIDGSYIVFDHGFGAYQRLVDLKVDLRKITHVFFTHLHFDHIGDFARLVLTRWDQFGAETSDLQVFGPPPLARTVDRLFADDGVFGPDLIARTNSQTSLDLFHARGGVGQRPKPRPVVKEIGPGDVVTGPNWRLETDEALHVFPYLTCNAYRLTHRGKTLVYSGDSGPSAGVERLARGCDVLIHMCCYESGTGKSAEYEASCTGHREAAAIAARGRVGTLVLTHIANGMDMPGSPERLAAEMAHIFDGTIIMARDLLEIPVGKEHVSNRG